MVLKRIMTKTDSAEHPTSSKQCEYDQKNLAHDMQDLQDILQQLLEPEENHEVHQSRVESQAYSKLGAKKTNCATTGGYLEPSSSSKGGYPFASKESMFQDFSKPRTVCPKAANDPFAHSKVQRNPNHDCVFKNTLFHEFHPDAKPSAKPKNQHLNYNVPPSHGQLIRDEVHNLFNCGQQRNPYAPKDAFNQHVPSRPAMHPKFKQPSTDLYNYFNSTVSDRQREADDVNAIEICHGPDDIFEEDEEDGQMDDLEVEGFPDPLLFGPPPGLYQAQFPLGGTFSSKEPEFGKDSNRTTLMISNIPTRCTQARLLDKWPADGSFDFLYLPCRFGEHKNFGYAFVNFVSHDLATEFYSKWQGKVIGTGAGIKPLVITWASIQGRDQNIKQSLNRKIKRIRNPNFQPAIFEGSIRVDFNKYLEMISEAADWE